MAAVTTDSKAVSSVKSESRIGAETNHDAASGAKCFAGNAFSDVRRNYPRHVGQTIVLGVCAVFFLLPLLASLWFGIHLPGTFITFDPLMEIVHMPGVGESIALSIGLALMTCLFSLVLMLPTLLILHLKAPQMLPVAEGFSVLPYVVPAIALVSAVGPLYRIILPQALNSPLGLVPLYMVVIMPFVYRSLDAGIRVVDVRTLWDASSSLGAGAVTTLVRAILPNLRSAIMSASLLGCAIVLGEFAIAQLLLKTTFPVILSQIGTSHPHSAAALAFITIMVTWILLGLLSMVGGTDKHRTAQYGSKENE